MLATLLACAFTASIPTRIYPVQSNFTTGTSGNFLSGDFALKLYVHVILVLSPASSNHHWPSASRVKKRRTLVRCQVAPGATSYLMLAKGRI